MDQDRKTGRQLLEERGQLSNDVVAVEVGKEIFDLHTPLPAGTTELRAIRQNDPKALPIIRHSTAHVMADAVQKLFPGTKVAFGPATENGFFYDYDRPNGSFSESDLEAIELATQAKVKSPRARNRRVPQDLDDIVGRDSRQLGDPRGRKPRVGSHEPAPVSGRCRRWRSERRGGVGCRW